MARLESVAIGGYYKTPSHLVPLIAQALSCGDYAVSICDPCAGDGEAVQLLSQEVKTYSTRYYTAELESNRSTQCRNRLRSDSTHIHGDAFLVFFDEALSNILYLNPPYDTDRVHGRLEQRFLTRFKSFLVDGGVLVYVVPYYALAASKEELGKYFEDVSCWRFPDEDYAAYKQVVLFGRKTTNLAPDPLVMAQVDHWVNNPDAIPVLGTGDVVYHLPYAAYGRRCLPPPLRRVRLHELEAQGCGLHRNPKHLPALAIHLRKVIGKCPSHPTGSPGCGHPLPGVPRSNHSPSRPYSSRDC